jgi:hypothetical protein
MDGERVGWCVRVSVCMRVCACACVMSAGIFKGGRVGRARSVEEMGEREREVGRALGRLFPLILHSFFSRGWSVHIPAHSLSLSNRPAHPS